MAQLAIGVVGAVIGAPFGMSSLGFSIGSAIGGALFSSETRLPSVSGPRIADLRVQNSAYGQPIPLGYGIYRIAGNIIWTSGIKETPHVSTSSVSGGKGGGGKKVTQEQTYYTYSMSMAIGICEGPIVGVRRIWANGKLIYSRAEGASAGALQLSAKLADRIGVYVGSETQLPDVTMEEHLGAGNVPAYRGLAYIVFDEFQLADFGNAPPNFTFEVVGDASVTQKTSSLISWPNANAKSDYDNVCDVGSLTKLRSILNDVSKFYYSEITAGKEPLIKTVNRPGGVGSFVSPHGRSMMAYPVVFYSNAADVYTVYDGNGAALFTFSNAEVAELNVASRGQNFYLYDETKIWRYVGGALQSTKAASALPTGAVIYAIDTTPTAVYVLGNDGSNNFVIFKLNPTTLAHVATITPSPAIVVNTINNQDRALRVPKDGEYYIFRNDTGSITKVRGSVNEGTWFTTGCTNSHSLSHFNVKDDTALICWKNSNGTRNIDLLTRTLTPNTENLSEVVEDICKRAGMATGDIDSGTLTSVVNGFVLSRQASARSALEILKTAYRFDVVETAGALRFLPRSSSVDAVISEDAFVVQGENGGKLAVGRSGDEELPSSVEIIYINPAAGYQQGVQRAKFINAKENVEAIELPLVLTNTHAAQIAASRLHSAWQERVDYSGALPVEYLLLDPGDVIQVQTPSGDRFIRLQRLDYTLDGRVGFQGVEARAPTFTQDDVTSEDGTTDDLDDDLDVEGATSLYLLDIPIMRDVDNEPGFYVGVAGHTNAWAGATVFKSIDDGASFSQVSEFVFGVTAGAADTALANFTGGNIFDETNTVTVTLDQGSLFSVAETNALAGENAALLGNEVIVFKTATLVSGTQYILSGLLRGRRGTEWAMASHVIGDRFILLNADTLRRVTAAASEINLERLYKAVSSNDSIQATVGVEFTNTAVGLKPFAPVHLSAGRDASGNVVVNWVRRARVDGGWRDKVDVPLDEATESYEIEVWTSGFVTLKRTLVSALPTVTYTAADQVTDFGSTQASVSFKVYQLSATVGRGYAAQGVL